MGEGGGGGAPRGRLTSVATPSNEGVSLPRSSCRNSSSPGCSRPRSSACAPSANRAMHASMSPSLLACQPHGAGAGAPAGLQA